jgi:translation initiation factor IF-1
MIKFQVCQQDRMKMYEGDYVGFNIWRFHGTKGQEDYAW